jgi:hypothetical protein
MHLNKVVCVPHCTKTWCLRQPSKPAVERSHKLSGQLVPAQSEVGLQGWHSTHMRHRLCVVARTSILYYFCGVFYVYCSHKRPNQNKNHCDCDLVPFPDRPDGVVAFPV